MHAILRFQVAARECRLRLRLRSRAHLVLAALSILTAEMPAKSAQATDSLKAEAVVPKVERQKPSEATLGIWVPLEEGQLVSRGDEVRVGDAALLSLSLGVRKLRLDAESHIEVSEQPSANGKIVVNIKNKTNPEFVEDDFLDVASLVRELTNSENRVSAFVLSHLPEGVREAILQFARSNRNPAELKTNLVQGFSALIQGELIYESNRFEGYEVRHQLRPLTRQRLKEGGSSRASIKWLNRLLLEDVYKDFIAKRGGHIYYKSDQPPERIAFRLPDGDLVDLTATELHIGGEAGDAELTMISGKAQSARLGKISDREQIKISADGTVSTYTHLSIERIIDAIQWALYYPAALDIRDLNLTSNEQRLFRQSLDYYRRGNVLAALTNAMAVIHDGHPPTSGSTAIYIAALKLAVGQVAEVEQQLREVDPTDGRMDALASCLERLIAAVKLRPNSHAPPPKLATEWLAESYYQQSLAAVSKPVSPPAWETNFYADLDRFPDKHLRKALRAALEATTNSPDFGFAWARVAELEFSFGNKGKALEAVDRALQLSPDYARAHAVKGFILSAFRKPKMLKDAKKEFKIAAKLDGGLGDAWLGLGLLSMRTGDFPQGLQQLQTAAAQEPQISLFRSYLGKGLYSAATQSTNFIQELKRTFLFHGGSNNLAGITNAQKELELAKWLNPKDPTPFLYSSLMEYQENQINEAVRDLEQSKSLNQNRQLFRSQFLLDQDQAVRSANLAAIYREAGLFDVSVNEATRALNSDYGNYSAHLFLANSYDALRDPQQFNLRYETPWLNELLLANLLKPVGAGSLSQNISQQEYSQLFERDHVGVYSSSEYGSRGDWLENGSLYFTKGPWSASFDAYYLSQNGYRANQDQNNLALWGKVKYQITPNDSVLIQALYADIESGDLAQHYDPASAGTTFRVHETEEPILLAGYHRNWAPGQDTLLLLSRLDNTQTLTNANNGSMVVYKNPPPPGTVDTNFGIGTFASDLAYKTSLEIYSAELQHIWKHDISWWRLASGTLVAGARGQFGEFKTEDSLSNAHGYPIFPPILFPSTLSQSQVSSDFSRFSAYAYENLEFEDLGFAGNDLLLTLGVCYDYLHYPVNHRVSPVSDKETHKDQVSPKVGLTWTPNSHHTLRAAYTRSLGGVSFDQSFRLEPVQVAGFLQSFRSLIPESVAGALVAPTFETWGVGYDLHLNDFYLGVAGEWLESEADKVQGVYDSVLGYPVTASELTSSIDYRERNLSLYAGYLAGDYLSFNARYRLSHADYKETYESSVAAPTKNSALLHELNLSALFNLSSADWHGLFGGFEAVWRSQDNYDYTPALPGDDFWQFNVFAGYRFPRRRAELRVGVLNLTDQDYRLNPLNLHIDPPRARTFAISFKFNLEAGL